MLDRTSSRRRERWRSSCGTGMQRPSRRRQGEPEGFRRWTLACNIVVCCTRFACERQRVASCLASSPRALSAFGFGFRLAAHACSNDEVCALLKRPLSKLYRLSFYSCHPVAFLTNSTPSLAHSPPCLNNLRGTCLGNTFSASNTL